MKHIVAAFVIMALSAGLARVSTAERFQASVAE